MPYLLKISDTFDAAHRLPDHPGKCKNIHGHTWKVEVRFVFDKLNAHGMGTDFLDLRTYLKYVLAPLDHTYINEMELSCSEQPTAENIAKYIYDQLPKITPVYSVTVHESSNSSVTYWCEEEDEENEATPDAESQ